MAPPPNPNLPLQERFLALAKTLQFAWFVGHLTLILTTTRYTLSWIWMNYYSRMAQFSYRTSFIAAAVTYGIVVYKTQRARAKTGAKTPGGVLSLLSDENVQYLLMALVWLFAPQYPLALLPYTIYSIFHVATYTRTNLIPALLPVQTDGPDGAKVRATHPLADRIGAFVKEYYDASMSIVSSLEILLWIRLLLASIIFQRRSWILIAIYTAFLRARFSQSSHVQTAFSQLGARVDSLVGAQGTPPAAKQVWDGVKTGARQFHDVTDASKYLGSGAPAKKDSSGPSQTYPQRAYRNPLDRLVEFLDSKHGSDWAIWEFRAEGTGYPDHLVYNRVRHYPWPDHHPPPFRLIPLIMASMRNWLHGGELEGGRVTDEGLPTSVADVRSGAPSSETRTTEKKNDRVVVVHCKAGKGRSGTISCSYLISEEGWTPEDALARFTQRRMRASFGAGVSIPSQLRWVSYVDRWTRGGKKYIDRPLEIVEIHAWGLRNGVKVAVEGFVNEGKKIETFHTFTKAERLIVEGDAPEGGGFSDMVWEMAGYTATKSKSKAPEQAELADATNDELDGPSRATTAPLDGQGGKPKQKGSDLIDRTSSTKSPAPGRGDKRKTKTINVPDAASTPSSTDSSTDATSHHEPGGMAVIFKPETPIRIPSSDVCISVERRNRSHKSMGLTLVSAVAHVWFNAFFEGQGPEQDGKPSDSGVFAIEWEALDGIKGSSRKGARALDRMAVVWRAAGGEDVSEPPEGQPVPQLKPADWKGANQNESGVERDLGLRTMSPTSADVSKASSLRSAEGTTTKKTPEDEAGHIEGVKSSGPKGEELKGSAEEEPVKRSDAGAQQSTERGGETSLESADAASNAKKDDSKVV
ncbi:Pore membrane protein of 33 kDa [Paramyrothecium foliicola]|nr:Pore membrane protein of 33 kDa [Paramyrothecium foliicola]